MKEIMIRDNETDLRVYINGVPDLQLLSKEMADSIFAELELQAYERYISQQKQSRRAGDNLL